MPIGPQCSTEREGGKEGRREGGRGIKRAAFAEAPLRCEGAWVKSCHCKRWGAGISMDRKGSAQVTMGYWR